MHVHRLASLKCEQNQLVKTADQPQKTKSIITINSQYCYFNWSSINLYFEYFESLISLLFILEWTHASWNGLQNLHSEPDRVYSVVNYIRWNVFCFSDGVKRKKLRKLDKKKKKKKKRRKKKYNDKNDFSWLRLTRNGNYQVIDFRSMIAGTK